MPFIRLRRTGRTNEEQRKVTVIADGGSCGLFLFQNTKGAPYMREANSSGWPFEEVSSDGFDMDAIFGGKKSNEKDPFEDAVAEGVEERAEVVSNDPAPATVEQKPAVQKIRQAAAKKEDKELNPIEAAYQQTAAENAQQGFLKSSLCSATVQRKSRFRMRT